ncbi:AAA family ATPase [bacterium]|nr:AAA family ATPase [bacterium]
MLQVVYPLSRYDSISKWLDSFNANMVNALQRTVLELRQSNRANDHKFRSLPNNNLWISDIGGRRGGRLLYFKKGDKLIIWGLSPDHKIEEEADRYFTNIAKENEAIDGDFIDVTAHYLSSEEQEQVEEKSKIFAGNLSDNFLKEKLLLDDYQIKEIRQSNELSLWTLHTLDDVTRFKLTQFLKLPDNVLLQAKDEKHLLDFIQGSKEKLMIHLDDYQEKIIANDKWNSCLIRGETGSGKTTILIYKAIYYAEAHPDKECILFTYNIALANMIKESVEELIGQQIINLKIDGIYEWLVKASDLYLKPQKIIEISPGYSIYTLLAKSLKPERSKILQRKQEQTNSDQRQLLQFLKKEIDEVIYENGLTTESEYLYHKRVGTDRILGKRQRKTVWSMYQEFIAQLQADDLTCYNKLILDMLEECKKADFAFKHDAIFADEIQDLSPVIIRTIKALLKEDKSLVVLAGDYKQSIYRKTFSWKDVSMPFHGQNVVILRKNYRNSIQILNEANRLIKHFGLDWKEPVSSGRQGKEVDYLYYQGEEKIQKLAGMINFLHFDQGIEYADIAVFSPSKKIEKITDQLVNHGIPAIYLKNNDAFYRKDCVKLSTLHSAKGLEFRVVILIDIEKDLFNMPTTNKEIKLLQAVKLLYVGMTRAYDCLFFFIQEDSCDHPKLSEFLTPKLRAKKLARGEKDA